MKNFTIISITLLSLFATTTFADDKKTVQPAKTENLETQATRTTPKLKDSAEFQRVIDEYKDYVSKIPASVRDEIITYRKEVAKINKEKRLMYKKLSQESQDYLSKEQEYKKKLPLSKKALINVEAPGEKVKEDK